MSEENGVFFVEFVPQDVGTYIMDVFVGGQKLSDSPVFYKVYDATLIRITEAGSGVVGQPCQFKVDASQAVSNLNIRLKKWIIMNKNGKCKEILFNTSAEKCKSIS